MKEEKNVNSQLTGRVDNYYDMWLQNNISDIYGVPTILDLINFDRFQHETRKHGFYTFNYNISCNDTCFNQTSKISIS